MHVDRMLVRHVDADLSERVDGTRILTKCVVHSTLCRPVEGLWIDLLPLGIKDADLHFFQVAGVFPNMRDDILLDQRDWDCPCRIQIDRRDTRFNAGRWAVALADDGNIPAGDLAALDSFNGSRRNVHHDIAVAEGEGRSCKPLSRSRE